LYSKIVPGHEKSVCQEETVMFLFDTTTAYLLVAALATLLVAVLVWQPYRSRRTVIVWLASGVIGVLLGSVGSYAALRLAGYTVAEAPPWAKAAGATGEMDKSEEEMHGGMHGGGGKMKGNGVRGAGGHKPKLCLIALVQKLDLLTGDVGIALSAEQATAVSNWLEDVKNLDTMSDTEARIKRNQLAALFNDNQKLRLNAIDIPPPGVDGEPGMGPGMGGEAAPMNQDQGQNPSQKEDALGKAVRSLRERLASKRTAPKSLPAKAETSKTPAAKAETPKAPPPKADASKSGASK
jgi:hypothetical protein